MPLFSHLRRNLFFRKAILCIIPFCVFSENGFAASAKERCSGYKPTYVMAPNGAAETSQYDEEGRLISHLDFTGKSMQLVYDNAGTQITESDPNGLVTTRTLDASWKNLPSVTTPLNGAIFTYDGRGNLLTKTKTIDGVSQGWVYTYDSVGRLTSYTHPQTGKTSYIYDASCSVPISHHTFYRIIHHKIC